MICLMQLVINKAPSSMVALGLKIPVLDLSLILFIKSELLCRCFAPLSNSKIMTSKHDVTIILATLVGKKRFCCLPKFPCNIRKILSD